MKKLFLSILTISLMITTSLRADGFGSLWKEYDNAKRKDLPQTKVDILNKIIAEAAANGNYGNLMKAETQRLIDLSAVSADSIAPALKALEQREAKAEGHDMALAAVYSCVLADAYGSIVDNLIIEDREKRLETYKTKALANPEALAAAKATDYVPLVKTGADSRIFNNDLLSLIGYKMEEYQLLADFYKKAGNRRAALQASLDGLKERSTSLMASRKLKNNAYINELDRLIQEYGDLPECGAVAEERYSAMRELGAKPAEKAEWLKHAQKRWAKWENAARFSDLYKDLTAPSFQAHLANALPEKPDTMDVRVRNVKELTLTIHRLNLKEMDFSDRNDDKYWNEVRRHAIPSSKTVINKKTEIANEYDPKDISIALPPLKAGLYLMEMSCERKDMKTQRETVAVSDMYAVRLPLPKNKTRIVVVSATTGQPVGGAKVDVCIDDKDKPKHFTANERGEVTVNSNSSNISSIRAYTDSDCYMQPQNTWGKYFSYYGRKEKREFSILFTDRGIYRPGQTVHASAVAYTTDGLRQHNVAAGRQMKLQLYDANRKMIEEKTVNTDEYGTASADFTLPSGGHMNGKYSVHAEGCGTESVYFSVEEYKRPTFEVEFDEVKQEYHNGDTVTITGRAKTYAGVAVQGATVRYNVVRDKMLFYWFSNQGYDKEELYADTVTTDGNGEFKVSVPVILPEGYGEAEDDDENEADNAAWARYRRGHDCFRFLATATVTDVAGESHEQQTSLKLSDKATSLYCNMPYKVLADKPAEISVKRFNASAKEIEGDVRCWFDSATEKAFTIKANERTVLDWQKLGLSSGSHEMWAACGKDTVSCKFTLFSLSDKRPVIDTADWAYISAGEFPRNGEPVQLQIGSSRPDTHILYSIISGNKEIESGSYDISDSLLNLKYAYKEEYGEGVLLNFIWVKDGEAYKHSYSIRRPLNDKSLCMEWKTFRDKLTPGQKETWTLTVKRPEIDDKINSREDETDKGLQMAAWMYDKSLDQIQSHTFKPYLWVYQQLPSTQWAYDGMKTYYFNYELNQKYSVYRDLAFSQFSYDMSPLFYSSLEYGSMMVNNTESIAIGYGIRRPGIMMKSAAKLESADMNLAQSTMAEPAPTADSITENKSVRIRGSQTTGGNDAEEEQKPTPAAPQLRENLNETAFFYPALYADKNGDVSIEFTLPESVTTWNFHGFAHDKYMNFGTIEGEAVASKKVMVMPNVPRFVRQGDKATISTRVVNNTEDELQATVRMELIDPETEKAVFSATKKVQLTKNATESVSFSYTPGEAQQLLICRISADGKTFSDGEQHYLPILPAKERVINTLPFSINEKGESTFDISRLFPKNADNRKLTVEYTANPAWLMIQALPYMAETNQKNAISLAAAYYANVLGKHIMEQSPAIKKVVELWRQEQKGASSADNSLMSQLERNQELKQIVLSETPWVMDADKEAEQKRMLTTYFDESAMSYRIKSQLEALAKLQKSDGSWSWWEGMNGSPSITATVLQTLARLNVMAGTQQQTKAMISRAMTYLGNFCLKEYEDFKKNEKEGKPVYIYDAHAIQYLYINTLLKRELPAKEREMKDYLLSYLRKDRERDIYSKALMAIILNGDGQKTEAKEYIESIRQYTVFKPEAGRYFDSPRALYSWFDYRIPTQTAAIEAIKSVAPADKQTIDEMRLWLLQSKRTQAWDTPINSVNAVYAFLDNNFSALEGSTANSTTMAIDGKRIATDKKPTAGLGYTKTSTSVNGAAPKQLRITKGNDGTSWGAVYAQFAQDAAEITDAASGIKITRTVIAPEGKDANSLTVGDKVIVRLTITADRDYDFVAVEDKRAACMEPANQTSGYAWGYYCSPKDNATCYYFDRLAKGKHMIDTEYFIDRAGAYTTGSCSVQCAYSPEYCGREAAKKLTVK